MRHTPFAAALHRVAPLLLAVAASAGPYSGTRQSGRLYTPPDPSARGGLQGALPDTGETLVAAYAVNALDPAKVYLGRVEGDGRLFSFTGLPVGKYDVVLLFPSRFVEGLTLHRDTDTLTEVDRERIAATINASVPFFDTKRIHRLQGSTGRGGKARAVLQEVRTGRTLMQSAQPLRGIQPRSIKLALLEEVGVGWHLVNTREILRMEAGPGQAKGLLPHAHSRSLQGIRVTDEVRDLGPLDLR